MSKIQCTDKEWLFKAVYGRHHQVEFITKSEPCGSYSKWCLRSWTNEKIRNKDSLEQKFQGPWRCQLVDNFNNELTMLEFFLWGYLQEEVYIVNRATSQELKDAIIRNINFVEHQLRLRVKANLKRQKKMYRRRCGVLLADILFRRNHNNFFNKLKRIQDRLWTLKFNHLLCKKEGNFTCCRNASDVYKICKRKSATT